MLPKSGASLIVRVTVPSVTSSEIGRFGIAFGSAVTIGGVHDPHELAGASPSATRACRTTARMRDRAEQREQEHEVARPSSSNAAAVRRSFQMLYSARAPDLARSSRSDRVERRRQAAGPHRHRARRDRPRRRHTQLADALRDAGITRVWSSDLARARETAAIVATELASRRPKSMPSCASASSACSKA